MTGKTGTGMDTDVQCTYCEGALRATTIERGKTHPLAHVFFLLLRYIAMSGTSFWYPQTNRRPRTAKNKTEKTRGSRVVGEETKENPTILVCSRP
ncbi:hypothetical protein CCUS01_15397 [Colletotrichum cuscutae]|uniref:Uncharacterized protein n=1 Tax=Colletotrichum cuscutae TaxID=1209917 RepID=A0AAI9VE29_9PEZI|nr:hypothetical protein CCUS01_15397 [Colletotrichum cuscutae]